jgi:hypothetical protein
MKKLRSKELPASINDSNFELINSLSSILLLPKTNLPRGSDLYEILSTSNFASLSEDLLLILILRP